MVNIAGDGDFLMTGQELATATGYGAGADAAPDQHRRRQRHLRHDPHAPGARVPGARQRQRPVQPRLRRARARLRLARATASRRPAQFEPAFAAALASERPTLLHLKLDAEISTPHDAERDPPNRAGSYARRVHERRRQTTPPSSFARRCAFSRTTRGRGIRRRSRLLDLQRVNAPSRRCRAPWRCASSATRFAR